MKDSLEKKYQDGNISEEEEKKYKLSIIIRKSVLEAIYLFMVIFSFARLNKLAEFFGVLGGGRVFSFYGIAMIVFYLTLYLVFTYNTLLMFYIAYCAWKKNDYLKMVTKLNVKLDLISFICKCLSILLFIMIYITTPCTVEGQSMDPTFSEGDRLMCIDMVGNPKMNDIVVFASYNYTREEKFYIKRVTAAENDVVSYDVGKGETSINGEVNADITYLGFKNMRESIGITDDSVYSFTVPQGKCMVLGDNRDHSTDSRVFGLIDVSDIFGKVYLRLLPINAIHFY